MKLRTITSEDYVSLFDFWKENYFVSGMDTPKHFNLFLEKNKDLSVLIEDDDKIVGTALVSYDGRRGYLQKVVTEKAMRKHGIGKQLVDESVKRLKAIGAVYIPISVESDLVSFYEKCGFMKKDTIAMSMDLGSK